MDSNPSLAPAPTCARLQVSDLPLRRREVVGGLLWFAVVQYFLMMVVVQAAWPFPYGITVHAISDLGAVHCGVFEGRDVCSPWHVASNVSWAVAGSCIVLGGILLWRLVARDVAGRVGLIFMLVPGLAELIVGFNPEDTSALHVPAAMTAILGGLTAVIVLGVSLSRRPAWRTLGRVGVVFGIVGFTSIVLWLILRPSGLFGLFERVAAYPILLWLVLAGVAVLRRARHQDPDGGDMSARVGVQG